jgi:predicted dithiol-disulfide oxidoreductase (DUF899 family)
VRRVDLQILKYSVPKLSPDLLKSHKVVTSKEEWQTHRDITLAKEKALMKQNDALYKEILSQPWLKIDKTYSFDTNEGRKTLQELFGTKNQLAVYHFMFGTDDEEGCGGCSFLTDQFQGVSTHLAQRDTAFVLVSSAPLEKINKFKARMGWTDKFEWVSSNACPEFNVDYGCKTASGGEMFAFSTWYKEKDTICLTYLTSRRGTEAMIPVYAILDRVAKGRDEVGHGWKYPMSWVKHHDKY